MTGSNGHNTLVSASPALRTLGGAALLDAATGATVLGPGKPLALLTYLALNPGHAATREFLTDLLWADLDGDRPRHALRQTLWQLRHVLGESAFAGRDEIRLTLSLASDRDDFLGAVERGDYDLAVDRYTGPFLPDLAVPGGVEFEHWADTERDRLRATFLRACEMATRRKLAASAFRDAQRIARRARDADPANELGWRLLLESLAAGQDFITATLEADALESRAAAEHRELEPATKSMIRVARRVSEGAPSREQELVADLIGREREYAFILEAGERAARGPATHVHLSAPAGLGKTRLLHDIRARLSAAGKRVVAVRAHPGERQIPFAMASELARAAAELPGVVGISPASAAALVALNPALSSRFSVPADTSGGDDALRNRAIALTEALMAAAEEAPFALLIDDLHWADTASRQLLDGILARLDGARIAVVTASRPTREAMPAGENTATLTLPPLTEPQVASFLASLGALPLHEPWARGIERGLHLATSGSPLLLLQLLKLALERGVLSLGEAGWRCSDAEALGRMLREGQAMRNRLDALPREQRWLVTTLAVAGIPLGSEALAHASSRPLEGVVPELEALERIGLVLRSGPNWELAHDEIGAVASEGLTDTAEHSAHRGIGGALMADASTDPVLLIRAARHLSAANDHEDLARCARRYVRAAWARGDGRSPQQLVAELLGPVVEPPVRARVAASLPVRWRLGLWSRSRLALASAAAAVLVIAAVTRALSPAAPDPTTELVLFARTDSGTTVSRLAVNERTWDVGAPLTPVPDPDFGNAVPRDATGHRFAPDGRRLVFTTTTGDTTTDDLFLLEDGRSQRLTEEARDDLQGNWSPDGRWIAFLTARWSEPGDDDYDLAVLDPASGEVRRLTSSHDWELNLSWSPDGSRIATARRYREPVPGALCIVSFDGTTESCREVPGFEVSSLAGWLDPGTILIVASRLEGDALLAYQIETGAYSVVLEGDIRDAFLSPDGAWLVVHWSRSRSEPPGHWVMPGRFPQQMRRLEIGANATGFAWRSLRPPTVLDTLRLGDLTIPLDGFGVPEVVPLYGTGGRLALPASSLRWSLEDSTIAVIDPGSGRITPRRPGTTGMTVTAGGWRTGTAALTVTPPKTRTVLVDSTWDDLDPSPAAAGKWRLYGEPLPRRVDSIGGPALSNNGDGVYASGVYSRELFPVRDGLGIEAVVSVPLSRPTWQTQSVQLVSERYAETEGWNHRSGGIPPTRWPNEVCSAAYPAGESPLGRKQLGVAHGGVGQKVPAPAPYHDGRWFRLRVQIFTDGTCGIAVDGKPVWHGMQRTPLDLGYRALIGGNSAETTVRVRKVEMWVGVRGDVAWGTLGSSEGRKVGRSESP